MKEPEKHIHKLKRLVHKSGNVVFFCVLDCSYKISSALALGKSCICWRCGEKFLMNEYSLRLAKPHCENCHKPKKSILPGSVDDSDPEGGFKTSEERVELDKIVELTAIEKLQQTLNRKLNQTLQPEDEGEI